MKLFKKFLIVLAIGLVPIIACDTDELIELNNNPNAVLEMDWRYLLTASMVQSSETRSVPWKNGLLMSAPLIQHIGSTSSADRYMGGALQIDYQTIYWDYYYIKSLKQAAEVIRQTGPNGPNPEMTNTYNVARIMYNWGISYMTDFYGNVPYFGANRSIEGEEYFLPKYDSQQDIYTREGMGEGEVRGGLLWELDDAAAKLATPGIDDLSDADAMHGGDLSKWRKTAYSLMLREAMRINEVDPATAKKYIDKAIAGGMMTSNDDNWWIPMAEGPDIWLNQNGYSRGMIPGDGSSHSNSRLSETIVDFMKDNDDPRLMILSGGVGTWDDCVADLPECDKDPAAQIGRPNGYDNGDDDPADGSGRGIQWWCANDPDCSAKWDGVSTINPDLFFSCVHPDLLDVEEPNLYMGYAEVELLLAECAERGITNTPKSAAQHYADGVRADMQRWVLYDPAFVVTDAQVDAYLLANPYTPGTAGVEQIAWQYWLATFLSSVHYETYAYWRRTGRPTLIQHDYPNNTSGGKIFRRFVYDPQDVAINSASFNEGATKPNLETTRIWWDMGYDGASGGQTQ